LPGICAKVRIKPLQNKRLQILEVGCGSGTRTLALLKDFEEYHLNAVFVDTSLHALSFAKRSADNNKLTADFIVADAFKLPFPDDTFDIVWNEGVNEHFEGEKRQKIFDEMARVCKVGRKMIVIVPNALNLPYRITKKLLEIRNQWIYGFEKPFTIFELKRRMKDAGVTPSKMSGAQVITSLLTFLELIYGEASPKKKEDIKVLESNTSSSKIKRWFKILKRIDEYLEKVVGALLGKDIGIKGVKDDRSK
jgi:SAM-dependent methyltransferase